MNAAQRRDWLMTVAECFPELRLAPLGELLEALDAAAPGAAWEGGVCAGTQGKTLAVRCFGEAADYPAWRRSAAAILKLDLEDAGAAPSDSFPWLSLAWNASTGEPARVSVGSGRHASVFSGGSRKPAKVLFRPERYAPLAMEDAGLAKVLADFDGLCPIGDLVFQFAADGPGEPRTLPAWALRLKEPLEWPLFVRLDLPAAFAAEASQLSFFLLERRVTELGFDAEKLWAYFRE
jgi:hypothetical protein